MVFSTMEEFLSLHNAQYIHYKGLSYEYFSDQTSYLIEVNA